MTDTQQGGCSRQRRGRAEGTAPLLVASLGQPVAGRKDVWCSCASPRPPPRPRTLLTHRADDLLLTLGIDCRVVYHERCCFLLLFFMVCRTLFALSPKGVRKPMPACTIGGVFSSILAFSFLLSPARGVTETHGRHIDTRFIILRRRVCFWFIEDESRPLNGR